VTEIHFWLDDWEHQCCGDQRKVGDRIQVPLWFEDVPTPSDDPAGVESLRDGTMVLVGDVINRRASEPFLLIDAGVLTVACRRRFAGERLRCEGRLWEERHEEPVPAVEGTITAMRWHKALYEKTDEGHRVIGYEEPAVIYNTNKYPGYPPPEDPKRVAFREGVRSGKIKGPFTFQPAPMDDYVPSGWAFQFTVEVPN
jgi:hypothetical protein